MPDVPVLTIDGPSGSGKGTITRLVADELGWHILDSGAIYRVLSLYALQKGVLEDTAALVNLAHNLPVKFLYSRVFLEEQDVSTEIRSEECGAAASKIAVLAVVREALLERQRSFAQLPGLVADGRDMGTVVFPQAFLKIYLDASAEERAKRRFLQLKESGYNVKLQDLVADIMQRDMRDKSRAVSPLKPASDAVILDTTSLGVQEVYQTVIAEVQQRLSNFNV